MSLNCSFYVSKKFGLAIFFGLTLYIRIWSNVANQLYKCRRARLPKLAGLKPTIAILWKWGAVGEEIEQLSAVLNHADCLPTWIVENSSLI